MRIMVVGGSGFIGTNIVKALCRDGHDVAVLDKIPPSERAADPGSTYLVDILNAPELKRAVTDFRPDIVLHLAAQISVLESIRHPNHDAETNIVGSINLISACRDTTVRRILYYSSGGGVYGDTAVDRIAEVFDPPFPMTPYACSKLAAEYYFGAMRAEGAIVCSILRLANVYGPYQTVGGEAGVIATFADRMTIGAPVHVNGRERAGDEGCVRDYVFVDDVVRATVRLVSVDDPPAIVNVSTGVGTSTRALAVMMRQLANSQSVINDAPPKPGDVARSVLRPHPGLAPVTSLTEGLALTLAWFRAAR